MLISGIFFCYVVFPSLYKKSRASFCVKKSHCTKTVLFCYVSFSICFAIFRVKEKSAQSADGKKSVGEEISSQPSGSRSVAKGEKRIAHTANVSTY